MIANCPLEEVDPPVRQQKVVEEPVEPKEPTVGREETEMNYVIMGFIVGVIILAVSDSIRA